MALHSLKSFIPGVVITALILTSCANIDEVTDQPNIIYIMADDLGYGDLGCYGSELIQTPNIDKLAAEGIRFTNHYAGTSVCAPSRCSLMTGFTTGHCQIRGNMQWKPYGQVPLAEEAVTVAKRLKAAGYKTTLVGKWGLGTETTSGDPLKHGFDSYYGYLCQVLAHNQSPEYLMENGRKVYLTNKVEYLDTTHWSKGLGSFPIEKNQFSQELFTNKALEFIETNKDHPFFLYFSVVIPHDNGEAPEGKRYSDIPSFEPYESRDWTESEKGYAAMITYLDTDIGKIINKLHELNLANRTLVLFTSDNGGGAPDMFFDLSNQPFRGHKRDMYEGGIRVPLIGWWPGKIQQGKVSDHPSAFWDFMPTACELAGVEPPSGIDGLSYLPELLGKKQEKHRSLYFEFHELGGRQAIIQGDWKCIRLNTMDSQKMVVELYNLREDPRELNNLAGTNPEIVETLIARMEESRSENEYFRLYGE